MTEWTRVTTAQELTEAASSGVLNIEVDGVIRGMPSLSLPVGGSIRGGHLVFGGRGVRVTTGNTLTGILVETPETEAAIFTDTTVATLGTLTLEKVTTIGQLAVIAEGALSAGHVVAFDVQVLRADVRGRYHRPHGYGVDALQGAFTLWNRQTAGASVITAELTNVSAGTDGAPVRGSGIFIAGACDDGGRGTVKVAHLTTGPVVSDGGIMPGTPDVISGGVFIGGGGIVAKIDNNGPVTTFGQNDMVLDNWGSVDIWHAHHPVSSHGPSGIGFVNFGDLVTLRVDAPIRTFGIGSRGFNLYDGSLREAHFGSISTAGDGAIGVQISHPLHELTVRGDITTTGSAGMSLVKGVQMTLQAMALSIKPGGSIDILDILGTVSTAGDKLASVELNGPVGSARVAGGIHATGLESVAVRAPELPAAFRDVQLDPSFVPSVAAQH